MSHQIYRSLTRAFGRVLKLAKKDKGNLLSLIDKQLVAMNYIDFAIAAEREQGDTALKALNQEGYWFEASRPTYFIEDMDLAERLMNMRVSMEVLSAPSEPITFAVAPPRNWVYQGIEIPAMLVTVGDYDKLIELRNRQLVERWNHTHSYFGNQGEAHGPCLVITYRSLDQVDDEGRPLSKDMPPIHATTLLDQSKIKQLLESSDLDVQRELSAPNINHDQNGMWKLTDPELYLQEKATRLAAHLWIYLQAANSPLKPGLPGAVQDGEVPTFGQGKYFILRDVVTQKKASVSHGEKAETERSWHWRQLRDERFYRNEHANKERGSRWVFVNPSTPGEELEAETVYETPDLAYFI